MRVLLMVGNSNISAREIYGLALQTRFPGWGISNMSGLPPNPATIIKSFDVLVYELFAADDPRRYKELLALWEQVKELETVRVVTHIEGPYREGIVAELESHGIICVGAPFSPQTVATAFERLAPPSRRRGREPDTPDEAARSGEGRHGLGTRLRGLFRRTNQ